MRTAACGAQETQQAGNKGDGLLASEGTNGTRSLQGAHQARDVRGPGDGLQTLGFKAQKQQNTRVLSRLRGNTGTLASKRAGLLNRCRASNTCTFTRCEDGTSVRHTPKLQAPGERSVTAGGCWWPSEPACHPSSPPRIPSSSAGMRPPAPAPPSWRSDPGSGCCPR